MTTLFELTDVDDQDEPVARRMIDAYFADEVAKAHAAADEAFDALYKLRARQTAWVAGGELSRHDAVSAAMAASNTAIRVSQPIIDARLAGRGVDPAVAAEFERAAADDKATRHWLRANGHPEVLDPDAETKTRRPGRSTRGAR